jgi:hypothetical protein
VHWRRSTWERGEGGEGVDTPTSRYRVANGASHANDISVAVVEAPKRAVAGNVPT